MCPCCSVSPVHNVLLPRSALPCGHTAACLSPCHELTLVSRWGQGKAAPDVHGQVSVWTRLPSLGLTAGRGMAGSHSGCVSALEGAAELFSPVAAPFVISMCRASLFHSSWLHSHLRVADVSLSVLLESPCCQLFCPLTRPFCLFGQVTFFSGHVPFCYFLFSFFR